VILTSGVEENRLQLVVGKERYWQNLSSKVSGCFGLAIRSHFVE
jgi:hypothetical protein